ncbi:hypothetical protein [Sphingobacterium sp. LRF_L2]|uniref:hypothetical protein n=1 Tax=Sphingobacterium sp. LRF_L2 TaxID=3369421 RepID=UPI003F5DFCEB
MRKWIRYGIMLLLFVAQLLFLSAIFREKSATYTIPLFILSIIILLAYTYLKYRKHEEEHEFESLRVAIWVPVGAVLTYLFSRYVGLSVVFSAACIGFLGSMLPNIWKKSSFVQQLPAALYCGAFVGMSSPRVADGIGFVLVAGFFTATFLVVSKSVLRGVGGKLGTLAFVGVLFAYLIFYYQK